MRILYHHRTQGRGAEGNHIVSIVTALRALGHEVDVLSAPGVDPFDVAATLPVDEQRTGVRGWSSVWKTVSYRMPKWLFELAEIAYNFPAWLRLRSVLGHGKYDLLYERYATFLFAGALAARTHRCAFLVEFNEVSGLTERLRHQLFPRICAWVERRVVARCDAAHAVSSFLGDRLVEIGLPRERLAVAPNGFERAKIRLTRSRDEMRRTYGLEDSVVLGFAGWFVAWDRLDFLAEVFTDVAASHPDLKLCLVGDGEPVDAVKSALEAAGLASRFVHTGPVPRSEVYDHLQMFDIGILPHSNVFGSPMIMLELMGLRVPIVAPKLPPIEDVQKADETALLFDPLNRRECVEQVSRLVRSPDLRRSLSETAFRMLVEDHTWIRTAEKILSVLPSAGAEAGTRRAVDLPAPPPST
jgi:glycosyltransferase involved in cell wall biosynthesis